MRCTRFTFCLLPAFLLITSASFAADESAKPAKVPATSPWDLKALSKPPAFDWVDGKSAVRSLMYKGEPYGGKATRVFAYYASPGTLAGDESLDRNLPAVVLIHGGGGSAFAEWAQLWAQRGYAAIAMDLAGYQPIEGKNAHDGRYRTRLEDGGPNQGDDEKFGSVDKPPGEQWPYHAVANAILAHSLIRSFKGVDPERTAVTGISWGGYLTCIVAGVDSRFKAAVPVYGCGFLHENSVWLGRFEKMSEAQRARWVELWDPSQYLPAVSMPILFVNGTNDFAYPLDSTMKSFDAVRGLKQLCVTVKMPHGHPAGWAPKEIGLFIDQHLREGKPLPVIGYMRGKDGRTSLAYESAVKITGASLHYATDTNAINKHDWTTVEAKVGERQVTGFDPPANATAWFITLRDERGAVVSSRTFISAGK
ncbi:MAG: alpha/beta fold hydrolase [Phycisphaeraceae bacterium]